MPQSCRSKSQFIMASPVYCSVALADEFHIVVVEELV